MTLISVIIAGASVAAISRLIKGSGTRDTIDQCTINFRDIIIENIQLLNTKLRVRLSIENPTDKKLTINNINTKILLGDTEIGKFLKSNYNKKINKETITHIDFSTYINNFAAGSVLYDILKKGNYPESLIVKGEIKVNGFNKNISQTVPLFEK